MWKQKLITMLVLLPSVAYPCPQGEPEGFTLTKKTNKIRLYKNSQHTAVIGLKCDTLSESDAPEYFRAFQNRTQLTPSLSYFSFATKPNTISRIYFSTSKTKIVQATITASFASPAELQKLESTITNFIR